MRQAGQRGFALLAALLAVVLVTLSSLVPLQSAALDARRERETELIFVGRQYRDAIASYHAATPGGQRQYPAALDDLLLDRRFAQPRRHLRRLYPDPMTGQGDWVLVRAQGRIVGLHSSSERKPLKQRGFGSDLAGFDNAKRLADWRFMADAAPAIAGGGHTPPGATPAPTPSPTPTPAPEPPGGPRPPGPSIDARRDCLFAFQRDITVCMNTPPFDPQCRALARDRFMQCLRR